MPEKEKPLSDRALAGNESGKGSSVLRHGERIAALGACRQRARAMRSYLLEHAETESHQRLSTDLASCANYLVFHHYYTADQIRLAKARTCKRHLACPFCARARAAKLVESNLVKFGQVLEESPGLKPAMLTLTVKNGEDLQERFDHLVSSFRNLQQRRRDWLKKKRGWTELAKVRGAVFSYEFTNTGTGWHPHIHAVVLLDSFIDREALSAEWEAITGDSKIIDVRRLSGEPVEAMCEVFKYAVKFADLPFDLNLEAYDTLKGKRLIGSFGLLHGVKVPEKLTDELLEDMPYIELFYRYSAHKGAYDLVDTRKHERAPGALTGGFMLLLRSNQVSPPVPRPPFLPAQRPQFPNWSPPPGFFASDPI